MATPELQGSDARQYVRVFDAPNSSTGAALEISHPDVNGWVPRYTGEIEIEAGAQISEVRCEDQSDAGGTIGERIGRSVEIKCSPIGDIPRSIVVFYEPKLGPDDWSALRRLERGNPASPENAPAAHDLARRMGTVGDSYRGLDTLKDHLSSRLGIPASQLSSLTGSDIGESLHHATPALDALDKRSLQRLIAVEKLHESLAERLSQLPDAEGLIRQLRMLERYSYRLGRAQREAELAPLVDPVLRKARKSAVGRKEAGQKGGASRRGRAVAEWGRLLIEGYIKPTILSVWLREAAASEHGACSEAHLMKLADDEVIEGLKQARVVEVKLASKGEKGRRGEVDVPPGGVRRLEKILPQINEIREKRNLEPLEGRVDAVRFVIRTEGETGNTCPRHEEITKLIELAVKEMAAAKEIGPFDPSDI